MFHEFDAAVPGQTKRDAIRQGLGLDGETRARLAGLLPEFQARLNATREPLDRLIILLYLFSRLNDSTAAERSWLLLSLLEAGAIDMALFAAAMGCDRLLGLAAPMPEPQPAETPAPPVESENEPEPEPEPKPETPQPMASTSESPINFLVEDDGKPVNPVSITSRTDDWLEAARRDFIYKVLSTEADDWIEIVDMLIKENPPERITEIVTNSLISPEDKELPSPLFLAVAPALGLASIWSAAVEIYAPILALGLSMLALRFTTSLDQRGALATARRLVPFPGLFSRRVLARLREPLYFYLYRNFPASLSLKLLPYIPKISQLTNQDGQNALHAAALDTGEHAEYEVHILVEMFSQFFDRGVNIHKKVSARYLEQLLAAGLNPFAKDKFDKTSVDYLFANGHLDAIRALFNDDQYGDAVWSYRDGGGRNPLHLAVIHNLPSIIHLMAGSPRHKQEFLEFIESHDHLGRRPADYISNKYPKIGPIGEITVTAFETAHTKATGKPVGWRTRS